MIGRLFLLDQSNCPSVLNWELSSFIIPAPGEERIEVSGELKRAKYAGLQEEGRKNGWLVQIWAIEIGCRGFPAASMATFLKDIGIKGNERRRKLSKLGEIAESASRTIWKSSHFKSWGSY